MGHGVLCTDRHEKHKSPIDSPGHDACDPACKSAFVANMDAFVLRLRGAHNIVLVWHGLHQNRVSVASASTRCKRSDLADVGPLANAGHSLGLHPPTASDRGRQAKLMACAWALRPSCPPNIVHVSEDNH